MAQPHEVQYEDALKRLERIVADLEGSELELEARLKKFEEGTRLARLLLRRLDQAKKKVELLVRTNVGEPTLIPYEDDAREDDERAADNAG